MLKLKAVRPLAFFYLTTCIIGASYGSPAKDSIETPGYWMPKDPPGASYVLAAKIRISGETATVDTAGAIALANTASRPISVLAFEWTLGPSQPFEASIKGEPLKILNSEKSMPMTTPLLMELPKPVRPGETVRLEVKFTAKAGVHDGQIHLKSWYPRLWWEGLPVRDSFKVKLDIPQGYQAAVSGRFDPTTGYYENDFVTTYFGVFLSNELKAEEAEAGGVTIRALFTEKGRDCALLCLKAAADIIPFYKSWLGGYPHRSLCIIPGGPQPWGGYPYASGIVVIHGQETYDPNKGEAEAAWWKWITAHEIGHQYWGESIMSGDVLGDFTEAWFMIGMGIEADKEYLQARGLGWDRYQGFIDGYLQGVKARNDTTMDAPPSLVKAQRFDRNNILIHGKGFTVLSALETVLGRERFGEIYRRAVREYTGKRIGWRDFRALCEGATGENLGWFFDDWARSNKILECRVASQSSTPAEGGYLSEVRVEYGLDSVRMPVPVKAVFKDGSSQAAATDRLSRAAVLRFRSRAPLKEVILDPEHRLGLVRESVPRTAAEIEESIDALEWTGTGEAALDFLRRPETTGIKTPRAWFKLGMLLFDGRYYAEACEAFKKSRELASQKRDVFNALIWMGNIQDLLGNRAAAVSHFKEALGLNPDPDWTLQHDQYNLRINKAWVEERLKTPFAWER